MQWAVDRSVGRNANNKFPVYRAVHSPLHWLGTLPISPPAPSPLAWQELINENEYIIVTLHVNNFCINS